MKSDIKKNCVLVKALRTSLATQITHKLAKKIDSFCQLHTKELNFCHALRFSNPYICAT